MHIVHLFVSYAHVGLCHFFSSSLCRRLAAASACGSSWTFLFTIFIDAEKRHLIVFDDLMIEAKCDQRFADLFTKGSHHRNLSVILRSRNCRHSVKDIVGQNESCGNDHYVYGVSKPQTSEKSPESCMNNRVGV